MSNRLGRRLAELRKNAKLRQEDVAEQLDFAQSSVSDWETGATVPSVATLTSLFEKYGLPPSEWAATLMLAQEIDEAAPTNGAA